jgi:hypothetical protein
MGMALGIAATWDQHERVRAADRGIEGPAVVEALEPADLMSPAPSELGDEPAGAARRGDDDARHRSTAAVDGEHVTGDVPAGPPTLRPAGE